MLAQQMIRYLKTTMGVSLILLISILIHLGYGCTAKKTLDLSASRPQVIVSPETIRLGVSTIMDTDIVFEGAGFKPGDSVFITLTGPNQVKAIVAEAPVKADGTFKAEVIKLTKAMEILKADIGMNEKFDTVIIITQPHIPTGVYTVKVTSMLSDLTAESKLTVDDPSVIDRIKDWIGKLLGKIQYKK